ncbi:hypothetical protein [Hydrogenophaga soli]
MPALMPCTPPAAPPDGGVDATTTASRGRKTDDHAHPSLPASQASERLPPLKRSPGHRPGAVAPRQPLNTLSLSRKTAGAPAAGVPHPDAAQHADTHESPQTQSHALSAVLTVNHTLDLDLNERPDTLALPSFPVLTGDLRRPDARVQAEQTAAAQLRRPQTGPDAHPNGGQGLS